MTEKLKQDVVGFVAGRGECASMVELARFLEGKIPVRGGYAWAVAPNTVAWDGMSAEFVSLMRSLVDEMRLFPHPAGLFTYAGDGGGLNLPITEEPTSDGYDTPHWLPVVFSTFPHPLDAASGSVDGGLHRSV